MVLHILADQGSTVPDSWKEAFKDEIEAARRIYEDARPKTNGHALDGHAVGEDGVSLDDFYAYMPMHKYIFTPSRELWPGSSINARIVPILVQDADGCPVLDEDGKELKLSASKWLDENRPVEQMTWAPGLPIVIQDRLISQGGWIDRRGVKCFNLYMGPMIARGDPDEATPWIDHVRRIYPNEADHIMQWLAQRVQRPQEKVNHALVLGGEQGIGKGSMLEPVKHAVGPWNFQEIGPAKLLGRFNGFAKSVVLRISEARDLGDINRYAFYEHLKVYTAAPPDVLNVDEKNLREHYVPNVCGVIITTNHKTDGIYLPVDDRRHYVAWSELTKEDFDKSYWTGLWRWYESGGFHHVAAYLCELDISSFDPKAPPPKTPAFWAIVDANRAPEDAELADALDVLKSPDAILLNDIIIKGNVSPEFAAWLQDRKNRRTIPYRLERCGYVPARNPNALDGLWKLNERRQVVYAKANLNPRDQIAAAARRCGRSI
jgi:hypothetical protein